MGQREAKKWSGIGLFSVANTRVVRRSAALMELNQNPYGKNFVFKEYGAYSSRRAAIFTSLGLILSFLIISSPLKRLVRRFLPQPGEGPSEEVREKGWFRGIFITEAEDGERQVTSIYGDGDPGYKSTSKNAMRICPDFSSFRQFTRRRKFRRIFNAGFWFRNAFDRKIKKSRNKIYSRINFSYNF